MRFFNLFTPARTEIVNKKSIDAALCGRSERPQNRTDATPCSSDVYNIGTRARRRLADVRLSGRSMVEMLGVLAIIGVLSVGAIAGYSKAMMKHKLNIFSQSLTQLVQFYITLHPQLQKDTTHAHSILDLANRLNQLPEHISYSGKSNNATDIFKNDFRFYQPSANNRALLIIALTGDNLTEELCQQALITIQPWSAYIANTFLQRDYGFNPDYEGSAYDDDAVFPSDKSCSSNRKCLARATVPDFANACRKFCDAEYGSCTLHFQFYFRQE